jgi:hypothetical protein
MFSVILDVLKGYIPIAIAFAVGIPFLFFRAGSINILMHRFWQFLVGDQSKLDAQLDAFVAEIRSTEIFRLFTNTKVDTTKQMGVYFDWIKKYGLSPRIVMRAARYLRIDEQVIVQAPSLTKRIIVIVLGIALGAVSLALPSVQPYVSDLTMNKSGVGFRVDGKILSNPSKGWTVDLNECRAGTLSPENAGPLNQFDAGVVCRSSDDGSLQEVAHTSRMTVGKLVIAALLLLMVGCLSCLYWCITAESAVFLARQIDRQTDGKVGS